jgi:hypothetical protein
LAYYGLQTSFCVPLFLLPFENKVRKICQPKKNEVSNLEY